MGQMLSKISLSASDAIPELHQTLKECVSHQQSSIIKLWDDLFGTFACPGSFWMRRKGLRGSYPVLSVWSGQDLQVLCPDISVGYVEGERRSVYRFQVSKYLSGETEGSDCGLQGILNLPRY
jgi:hypothetical protein